MGQFGEPSLPRQPAYAHGYSVAGKTTGQYDRGTATPLYIESCSQVADPGLFSPSRADAALENSFKLSAHGGFVFANKC
jgi:hypothetical protein